jgi:hypothetical protein
MRTKQEIAKSLGYKLNDSYGGEMWFKDGMNYFRLEDSPDGERIEELYYNQFKAARYALLFFILAVMDFALFKLTAPEFGVSLILLVIGTLSMGYAIEAAKIYRQSR